MPQLSVHAPAAIVVDVDARAVLWGRDLHAPRHPASLAKLMTVMVALDQAPLDRQVTVPVEATQVEGDSTVMGLSPGEVVTVEDLMYGVFLRSGNDAAETLARVFTDRAHFVDLMNRKAAALGMVESHFTNPTGLDDPAMTTSAYDMSVAAAAIVVRYSQVLPLSQAREAVMPHGASHKAYDMHALNRLVGTYQGATGLKTGYTDEAGYCLVGSAQRGTRHLVAVVMGGQIRSVRRELTAAPDEMVIARAARCQYCQSALADADQECLAVRCDGDRGRSGAHELGAGQVGPGVAWAVTGSAL